MSGGEWYPNSYPRSVRMTDFIMWPLISVSLFLSFFLVVPALRNEPPKLWVVAFVTIGPLLMMAWSLAVSASAPKQVRLDDHALVWESGFGKIHQIPRSRIVRLGGIERRRHGLAMCVFLDERGREQWIPITVANEKLVQRWLDDTEPTST